MEKIRVLIADDHPLIREGLRRVLEMDPRIEICDEVG
ncbi:MAG TPA: DNA-binding response regulator, partial [Peptococcaceae bacterium]|nr:DNA-binding response regulator [Peptococcaceae bacterium]